MKRSYWDWMLTGNISANNMNLTPEQAAKLISDYLLYGMHHSTKEAQFYISEIIKKVKYTK